MSLKLKIFKRKKSDRSDALLLNTFEMLGCATDVRSDVRRSEDSAWSNIPGSRENFHKCQENSRGCRRERKKQEKEEEDSSGGRLRRFHASIPWRVSSLLLPFIALIPIILEL